MNTPIFEEASDIDERSKGASVQEKFTRNINESIYKPPSPPAEACTRMGVSDPMERAS